jgi:hypothetical protein
MFFACDKTHKVLRDASPEHTNLLNPLALTIAVAEQNYCEPTITWQTRNKIAAG